MLKFDEQQCRGSMSDRIALAVTVNPTSGVEAYKNEVSKSVQIPTQIQLCLWFVDWIKDRRFKLHNDAARSNIGRAVIKLAESTNYGFRQIGELFRTSFPVLPKSKGLILSLDRCDFPSRQSASA